MLLRELFEEDGEGAQQAKKMGLIYKGFGRWADPRTGKVTHKTDGGRLVAIEPQQQEPSGDQEPDLDKVAKDLGDKPKPVYHDRVPNYPPIGPRNTMSKKADLLKRAQKLRQSWKQKGHTEDQATYARDFPKLYALDVLDQQGKDLITQIQKGMEGPKGKDPLWKRGAAKELRKHKRRVEKIRELPDDTKFMGDMDKRRTILDKLRADGDDTVSGMKGKVPRIVRR